MGLFDDDAVRVHSVESLIAMLLANDPAHAKLGFKLPQEEPELMQAVRLALALAANRSVTSLVVLAPFGSSASTLLVMLEALKRNTALLSFDLSTPEVMFGRAKTLQDEVGLAAAELIKQSQTLQSFAFRGAFTGMGEAAGVALAEAAGRSPALRSLAFEADRSMSDATGLALAEALGRSTTLRSFSVDAAAAGSGMGEATGQALAEALGRSASLRSFSVVAAGSEMGEATGQALAEALGRSTTLRSFSVVAAGSKMGEATGQVLAKALGRSASLESFSLVAAQGMGNATGQALAEALGRSSALRSFSLKAHFSRMGDPAGVALAEALGRSSTLRSFELQAAPQMGDVSFEALATAVASHTALRSFACFACGTGMSDGGGVAIAKALQQNSTLRSVTVDASNTRAGNNTELALVDSVKANAILQFVAFYVTPREIDNHIEQSLRRNTDLHAQRQALQQLAGWDESTRFASLRERVFRNKVFEFLYPSECMFVPLDYVDGKRIAKREEKEDEPQLHQPSPKLGPVAEPADRPANEEGTAEAKDEEVEQSELDQAMAASMHEANAEENSALAAAILLSKADAPVAPNFSDDVTLLHIRQFAKTPKVASAISESLELAACRTLVAEAGCELHPEWAGGAWLLLPFTQQQYIEAALELGPEHILVRSQDVPAVREAMKATAAKKSLRPKVREEAFDGGELVGASRRAEGGSSASSGPSQIGSDDMAGTGVELVVERTFYHFPLPRMDMRANASAPP